MDRVRKYPWKGKQIVLIDLTNCAPEMTLQVLPEAMKMVAGCPKKGALILTDVTGARYNKDVAEGIKEMTQANTPFVKGSAVVGVTGIQSVLLQTVIFLTRREIKVFPSRQEAQDWLASLT